LLIECSLTDSIYQPLVAVSRVNFTPVGILAQIRIVT
jgi:hypothetical protein